jgi:MtN3 and saliva related transmembrane protein
MIYSFEYIGLLAGLLSTCAFLPQVIKAIKTKKTNDISLTTNIILLIAIILWFIYGIFINSISLIIFNFIQTIIISILIYNIIKYNNYNLCYL